MWTEIDTDDALELLGPSTVDSRVRAFAVRQLSRADDDVSFRPNQVFFLHVHFCVSGTHALPATTCTSPEV